MQIVIEKAVKKVKNSVSNPKPVKWKLGSVNSIGEWGRQGDVYFELIDKPKENDLKMVENFKGQLAEGNTRGSRHCVNPNDVKAYRNALKENDVESGYILHVLKDTVVEHPDHGHVLLEGGNWVNVTYQVSYRNQQRQRVQD